MAPKTLATVLTLGITLMRAVPTWAVSARFNLLPIDSLIVQISDSLVNTYIPFIALVSLLGIAIAIVGGRMHWSGTVARFVIAMAILSIGLPGLSAIFDGKIATSVVFP
jgi:hypothetical protein